MIKELRMYCTSEDKMPFYDWLEGLRKLLAKERIRARLNYLAVGRYGDCESVGDGICELKIHISPGYRVYFVEYDETIILLLLGGDKKTQKRDIRKAKNYWKLFKGSMQT